MRFLIDADLPRRTAAVVEGFGHEAIDVRDIGLRAADDLVIAQYAQKQELCLITCDFGFADIRNYPPSNYFGFVVLQLPNNATAESKVLLIEKLLHQPQILDRLAGRLAIIAANRIRLRPA
jgi:predicted nuclease of predicted toxin-antitoxin system